MDSTLVDDIWEAVSDRVGEDLRVVTRYDGNEFQTRMREDVRAAYDQSEDREIVDSTIVEQLRLADTEDAFRAGELRAVVRVFDDAWVLSWPDCLPGKSGVIVSIQRDGSEATVPIFSSFQ